MTPQQRAEKIRAHFELSCCEEDEKEALNWITAQIEEAEREARADECEYWSCMDDRLEKSLFEKGYSAAKEQAAKIAETKVKIYLMEVTRYLDGDEVADLIRAMSPEEKK